MNINEIVETQRQFYKTNQTKDIKYRKDTLKKMRDWIKINESQIITALKADLNKDAVEGYMCEIGLTLSELNYQLKHISRWARKKYALTPLA